MWPSDSDPLHLSDDDVALVVAHRDWLSAAAIMGNQYFSPPDAPFTDANADGFGQRFTLGTEHISLTKRRRHGQSVDAWPIAKISTQMPLSANPTHQFNTDQGLLDAFAALPLRCDDYAERLLEAIPLFNQANRLCERTAPFYDLVFLGGALERLYEISGPSIAEKLADAVGSLFIGTTTASPHGRTWLSAAASCTTTRARGPSGGFGSSTRTGVRSTGARRTQVVGATFGTASCRPKRSACR